MLGRSLTFDFNSPPPEPEWVVDGLLERGTITLLSGDSGAGKSLVIKSLTVAIIQGKPWLRRPTHGKRVLVIDEENHHRVVHTRMHALGMTNTDADNLRYFSRRGVRLGAGDWLKRTQAELEEFAPDLVVIDSVTRVLAVDVNDNSKVAELYADVLAPIASQSAILLIHHERKPQQGEKRNAKYASMGARQWAGQADGHLALAVRDEMERGRSRDDGTEWARYPLTLEVPKTRDGPLAAMEIVIESEHDPGVRWPRVLAVNPDTGSFDD